MAACNAAIQATLPDLAIGESVDSILSYRHAFNPETTFVLRFAYSRYGVIASMFEDWFAFTEQ
jgi:hypothetical protein